MAGGVPAPPVDVGDGALDVLVADDHPMPGLLVPAGRGLHGDVNAVLDHLPRHRPRKVEPFAHGARGRQEFVGTEIERHASSLLSEVLWADGGCIRADGAPR